MKKTYNKPNERKFFSVYECILIVLSHILIFVAFLISPLVGTKASVLSMITSMIGVWGIVMISRGNYVAHYIYIVFSVVYSAVSISARYYGEAIIYLFIMLPIHIFSAISWKNNKVNNLRNEVQINKKITKLHMVISSGVCVLLSFPFYHILVMLNTEKPIFSTLSLSTSVLAAYFMLRRVEFFSVIFAVDDFFLFVLWGIQVLCGNHQYMPTVIVWFVSLINDIYSAICWIKRSKKRKK